MNEHEPLPPLSGEPLLPSSEVVLTSAQASWPAPDGAAQAMPLVEAVASEVEPSAPVEPTAVEAIQATEATEATDALPPDEPMDASMDMTDAQRPVPGEPGTAGLSEITSSALAAPTGPAKGQPRALPQTLTAARDAAAFVAQLFAEVGTPERAEEPAPLAEPGAALPADAESADAVQGQTDGAIVPHETAPAPTPTPVSPLHGQTVLILGLGTSGLSMARWCVRLGAQVTVADTREAPPQLASLQAELPQVRFHPGAFEADLVQLGAVRAVFKSPGLSPAAVAPVWQAALGMGLWVGGELDLFAHALQDLQAERGYAPKVLAITGTNGKTTTTALTGQLVAQAGKTVAVAGNIGPSLLDTLTQHLQADTLPEVWVLELSSFQLDGVQGFEPTAAAVLNLSQDHLDWHGSLLADDLDPPARAQAALQAYGAAKARIFGQRGLLVLNRDDPAVMAMLPEPVRAKLQKPQWREHLTFGLEMPQRPGDYGLEVVNGMAWLVRALEADETQKRRRGEEVELHFQRLMPAGALRIRGRHNALNALAALALAQAAGCALAPMLFGLREYRGEPHRVEPVAIVHEVEYFDDSKGTNVGATVAALSGLGPERRLVVILGGDGKGQDFSPLADPVARYARAVVLIGRDAPQLRAALTGTGVDLLDAPDLPQAVQLARQRAHAGDAVLMSPACASLDMFDNYEHRARVFVAAVQALAEEAGVAGLGGDA